MAGLFKDNIDRAVVEMLGERVAAITPDFDAEGFVGSVVEHLDELELKDRVNLIADSLAAYLPADYLDALSIVEAVARDDLGDSWAAWPLCTFVERHGVDHPERSLTAMATLTQQWSCEFALRPYLEHHLELTRAFMRSWATSDDEAVRRLPSEGSRPRLPWGPRVKALTDDPHIGIEILEMLYLDESETVRRSVANHLNDLSKAEPGLVVQLLGHWLAGDPPADDKLVRHALRTLVKNGDKGALGLLGFTREPDVAVGRFTCTPEQLDLGGSIELCAELISTGTEPQLLVIDFVIHHVTAAGGVSPKVFKWTTKRLSAGSAITLTKKRRIQQASTRRYHPGVHRVDLQIGGVVHGSTEFVLRS